MKMFFDGEITSITIHRITVDHLTSSLFDDNEFARSILQYNFDDDAVHEFYKWRGIREDE